MRWWVQPITWVHMTFLLPPPPFRLSHCSVVSRHFTIVIPCWVPSYIQETLWKILTDWNKNNIIKLVSLNSWRESGIARQIVNYQYTPGIANSSIMNWGLTVEMTTISIVLIEKKNDKKFSQGCISLEADPFLRWMFGTNSKSWIYVI